MLRICFCFVHVQCVSANPNRQSSMYLKQQNGTVLLPKRAETVLLAYAIRKSHLFSVHYIIMFPGIDKAKAKDIIEKAEPLINRISVDIHKGIHFSVTSEKGIVGQLESSGTMNSIFYKLLVHARGFHVKETKCVSCGKCAELCPLNNIVLPDGKPTWGNLCTHCMACINRCPTEAIEYKN